MTDLSQTQEPENQLPEWEMKAETIMEWILRQALEGVPPFSPADALVEEIRRAHPDATPEELARKLVKQESYKNFSTGFITGLGGFVTLPMAIPSSILASWALQARLVAAVAKLGGHDLEDPRIRKLVIWALFGDAVKEVLKVSGVQLFNRFTASVMIRLPAAVIAAVQRKLGFLFLERATRQTAAGLIKAIPIAGGAVSGMVDAAVLRRVGKTAIAWFLENPETSAGGN